jgi:hypothetical protein
MVSYSLETVDTAKLTDAKVLGWRQAQTTQNECAKGMMIGNQSTNMYLPR